MLFSDGIYAEDAINANDESSEATEKTGGVRWVTLEAVDCK